MHDKDQSGSIDMDECMEILFRRFGKEQLEARVNEFMSNDEDADKEISFTEFLHMDQKNDIAGTSKHPGFRLSAGMPTTKQENERLLRKWASLAASRRIPAVLHTVRLSPRACPRTTACVTAVRGGLRA